MVTGYAIVFAALLVPAGRLADLLGRKRLFLAGLGVFLVASALCGAATGPWVLIGARLLQAVGAALLIPTSLALLLPEFPPSGRAAAVGFWTAGAAVAATVGPTIGGLLVELSWRWVFLVNLPLGLITAVAAVHVLRESRDTHRARVPDLLGALLLAIGVGALALGIVKGAEWGWTSGRVAGVEVLAILALEAGLAFAPGPLMVALLSWPAGSLAGRVGPRPLAVAGTVIFALACVWWLWRVGASPAYFTELLPGIIVSGIGWTFMAAASLAAGAVALLLPRGVTVSLSPSVPTDRLARRISARRVAGAKARSQPGGPRPQSPRCSIRSRSTRSAYSGWRSM